MNSEHAVVRSKRDARAGVRRIRQFVKRQRGALDYDCSICLEKLIDQDASVHRVTTTVCGHAFHGDCWERYCRSQAVMPNSFDSKIAARKKLNFLFLTLQCGAKCPTCRHVFPTIDRFAEALFPKRNGNEKIKITEAIRMAMPKDMALDMASWSRERRDLTFGDVRSIFTPLELMRNEDIDQVINSHDAHR